MFTLKPNSHLNSILVDSYIYWLLQQKHQVIHCCLMESEYLQDINWIGWLLHFVLFPAFPLSSGFSLIWGGMMNHLGLRKSQVNFFILLYSSTVSNRCEWWWFFNLARHGVLPILFVFLADADNCSLIWMTKESGQESFLTSHFIFVKSCLPCVTFLQTDIANPVSFLQTPFSSFY